VAHPKRQTPPIDANRRVRVRSRRLEQIDEAKIAVALALMARRLLEDEQAREPGSTRREAS